MSRRTRRLMIGIFVVLLVLLVSCCLYFLFWQPWAVDFFPTPTDIPTPTNTPTPSPTNNPTPTPLSDDSTSEDEVMCETIWPELYEVVPSSGPPGSELLIKGAEGYIKCPDGFISESSRDFILMLDQVEIGTLNCNVIGCRETIRLNDDILPGTHTFTSEGGSEITFEILTAEDEVLCGTVWPVLYEVVPSSGPPGSELLIKGAEGYIKCTDGFINESSRNFILMLDQVEIGTINCYANGCRQTIRLNDDILPGTHTFTSEGGSEINFEILGE